MVVSINYNFEITRWLSIAPSFSEFNDVCNRRGLFRMETYEAKRRFASGLTGHFRHPYLYGCPASVLKHVAFRSKGIILVGSSNARKAGSIQSQAEHVRERAMSMFDLTSENAFGLSHIEADERAVTALLKQPALSYIRDLRQTIDQDPNFLAFHDRSVSVKIQNLLSRQGIFWDTEVFENQFPKLVTEAVERVKKLEQ